MAYVAHLREAATTALYTQRYLPKLLHINEGIIFLVHLAFYHYVRQMINRFRIEDIPFVPKEDNPPNVSNTTKIDDGADISLQQNSTFIYKIVKKTR